MNEPTKTLAFLAAALLSVVLAIATRPSTGDYDPSDQLGTQLAAAFERDDAKRLSIVKFDEDTATSSTFEVAASDGVWSLPSKGGYPADAERQLAEAVTGVTDCEILQIASEDPNDHSEYGVIDPTSSRLEPGQTGVGTRVSLSKEDGERLVDVIVGNEVKDQEDQRYVRRGEQDVVFVVEMDPEKFSTDFADWIEDDLLKINTWDIAGVRIRDYSAEFFLTLQGPSVDRTFRNNITLGYDDGESEWELTGLETAVEPKSGEFRPDAIGENQELDQDKLRELKNSLDDLRIVDVARKPESISEAIKKGEDFVKNTDDLLELISRGFGPMRTPEGELDILSSEGEIVCTMKDGVEYVLRFGKLELDAEAAAEGGQPPAEAGSEEGGSEGDETAEGVNRYLFVLTRFNADAIERPELEEVPPLPEGAEETAAEETAEGESTDVAEADADTGDEDAAEASAEADGDGEPSELEKAVAERKDIEERNARLLDEYEQKLEAGRTRVSELNARFGDWYYVISNDVFKKIHLGLDDIIKEKEADAEPDSEEPKDENASVFGAPGTAVPGLPGIGLAGASEEESTEESAEGETSEEGASEEPADDDATESGASEGEAPADDPAESPSDDS